MLLTTLLRLGAAEPTLFMKHCASCHGPDGRARTPAARLLGVKDLSESRIADLEIERQIREGRKDARGAQKMPPFKDRLNDAQVRELVAVVKGFRPPGVSPLFLTFGTPSPRVPPPTLRTTMPGPDVPSLRPLESRLVGFP